MGIVALLEKPMDITDWKMEPSFRRERYRFAGSFRGLRFAANFSRHCCGWVKGSSVDMVVCCKTNDDALMLWSIENAYGLNQIQFRKTRKKRDIVIAEVQLISLQRWHIWRGCQGG